MTWQEHLLPTPQIMGGAVCYRGNRIPVTVVLDNLAAGLPEAEIRAQYPTLPVQAGRDRARLCRRSGAASWVAARHPRVLLRSQARCTMQHILDRITVDPGVCGGRPCVRGLRIRVSDVLDLLAAGRTTAQILSDYPDLEAEDIAAVLRYASRRLDHPILAA